MQTPSIPEGYRFDAQGRLVHETMIKPLDQARDQLVLDLVAKARTLSLDIAAFKVRAFGDIETLQQLAAEEYGTVVGGKKGNLSLLSFDGRYRVIRAVQDEIHFDERLQAAKTLIDECLREWTEGARKELVALINDAFRVDAAGNIRTGRVLELRRMDITDERWQRAMKAISDAVQVISSKSYVRVYERVGDTDQWRQIPLDIASASLGNPQ